MSDNLWGEIKRIQKEIEKLKLFDIPKKSDLGGGGGDTTSPATNTDNAIARWDGVDSKTLQNSLATLDDAGSINIPTGETYDVNGSPHTHALGDHDHSGDAGDGGQFEITNLETAETSPEKSLHPDGLGGMAWGNTINAYSTDNVSNPLTLAQINSIFGYPYDVGNGFVGIIDDNGEGINFYMCVAMGNNWWYTALTKAAVIIILLNMLALDTFTGADTTHLNVHTMNIGSGWTEQNGSWTISGNVATQATSTGSGVLYAATTDISKANARISVKIKNTAASGNAFGGILGRFTDFNNTWAVMLDWVNGEIQIWDAQSSVWTKRASKTWAKQYQKWTQLDVEFNGNVITARVDGGYSITYTSSFNNTVTVFGICEQRTTVGPYTALNFDYFEVIDLPQYSMTKVGTVISATVAAEESNVGEPNALFEGEAKILTGDVFKMWYGGGWDNPAIFYAESTDGATWTKYSGNPIITGVARNCILKNGVHDYWLYAAVGDDHIRLYTSPDGLDWDIDTETVLDHGSGADWDADSVANCQVWKESANDYRMLYEAKAAGGTWQIGYATSTDGKTWTKSGSNPVLTSNGGAGSVGGPSGLVKVGATYYLWLHQASTGWLPTHLVRYKSGDLTTWTPWPQYVEIPRIGSDEGEDSYIGQASDVSVLIHNGTAYFYYAGSSDGSSSAGDFHIILITADENIIQGY